MKIDVDDQKLYVSDLENPYSGSFKLTLSGLTLPEAAHKLPLNKEYSEWGLNLNRIFISLPTLTTHALLADIVCSPPDGWEARGFSDPYIGKYWMLLPLIKLQKEKSYTFTFENIVVSKATRSKQTSLNLELETFNGKSVQTKTYSKELTFNEAPFELSYFGFYGIDNPIKPYTDRKPPPHPFPLRFTWKAHRSKKFKLSMIVEAEAPDLSISNLDILIEDKSDHLEITHGDIKESVPKTPASIGTYILDYEKLYLKCNASFTLTAYDALSKEKPFTSHVIEANPYGTFEVKNCYLKGFPDRDFLGPKDFNKEKKLVTIEWEGHRIGEVFLHMQFDNQPFATTLPFPSLPPPKNGVYSLSFELKSNALVQLIVQDYYTKRKLIDFTRPHLSNIVNPIIFDLRPFDDVLPPNAQIFLMLGSLAIQGYEKKDQYYPVVGSNKAATTLEIQGESFGKYGKHITIETTDSKLKKKKRTRLCAPEFANHCIYYNNESKSPKSHDHFLWIIERASSSAPNDGYIRYGDKVYIKNVKYNQYMCRKANNKLIRSKEKTRDALWTICNPQPYSWNIPGPEYAPPRTEKH